MPIFPFLRPSLRSLRTYLPWLLVCLNALAVGTFPATITLDGPMHVWHAQVAAQPVAQAEAGSLVHDLSDKPLLLGDRLTQWLLLLFDPFDTHTALLVLLLLFLNSAVLWAVRAFAPDGMSAVAWSLPISLGIPLLLGFFHFLLGVALAFTVCGAWTRKPRIGPWDLVWLIAAAALALFVHRGALLLLLLLLCCFELAHRLADTRAWRTRWSALPRAVPWVASLLAVAILVVRSTYILAPGRMPIEAVVPRDPLVQFLELRPLLLFDAAREQSWLIALGGLLLVAMALALATRLRGERRWERRDGLVLAGAVLLLASFAIRTPHAQLFYLVERAQWLALLLFGSWAMLCLSPVTARLMVVALLLVHVPRMIQVGRDMGHFQERQVAIANAAAGLPSGAVVVPVNCEPHWLYTHQGAFLAALRPETVFWGPVDHMLYRYGTYPSEAMMDFTFKRAQGWHWLDEHIRSGRPPTIDVLLIMGGSASACSEGTHAGLEELIDAHFTPAVTTGPFQWYLRK